MTATEQQMYDFQVPAWYYDDDAYIAWLMAEDEKDNPKDEKDNPKDDMPIGVAFGEIIYSEVIIG